MKKYSFKIIAIYTLLLTVLSCNIDEAPYSSVTDSELETNVDAVNAVTLGSYSELKSESFIKGYHYIGEYTSDNLALSGTTTDNLFFIYNFQRLATNSHLANQWGTFNKIIINCNNVLRLSKEGVSKELDHVIGENYFLRSWIFYQLAITYGKAYHIATAEDLGVPVKLTTDINEFPDRMPVKKMFEEVIVPGLIKAESLMQSSGIEKEAIFGNVWAAKALLSRVYLTMHKYQEAYNYANDVIQNSGKKLLTSAEYPTMNELVPERNPEAIFAIRRVKDIDIKDNGWYDIGSLYAEIDGAGWGEMYASEPLRNLLAKYSEDVRATFIKPVIEDENKYELEWIDKNYLTDDSGTLDILSRNYFRFIDITKNSDGTYQIEEETKINHNVLDFTAGAITVVDGKCTFSVRQKRKKANGEMIYSEWKTVTAKVQQKMARRNDYPKYYMTKCSYQEKQTHLWSPVILRLSEMYLNRAEAVVAGTLSGDAIGDINKIRSNRDVADYNPSIDGTDMLTVVLDERHRELYLEAHRFFDLMRNNQTLDRTYPGGHDRGAPTVVIQYVKNTDKQAIQLLPQREIDAYPKPLPQNPI